MKNLFLTVLLTGLFFSSNAQRKFGNSTGTFLMTDKQVYIPGETIYFTARLLNVDLQKDSTTYHTLFVSLVNGLTRRMVCADTYLLSVGLAAGVFHLPKDLPSGEYLLFSFTNNLAADSVEQDFHTWLSIRKPAETPFKVPETSLSKTDSIQIKELTIPDPNISVSLKADSLHYKKRDSIHFTIGIKDATGNPVKGLLTVSCVLRNRLKKNGVYDIRKYFFVDQFLQHLDSTTNLHISPQIMNGAVTGYLTKDGRVKRKKIPMTLMKNNGVVKLATDSLGIFKIRSEDLLTLVPGEGYLTVSKGGNSSLFMIHFLDIAQRISDSLASRPIPYQEENSLDSVLFSSEETQYWVNHSATKSTEPAPATTSQDHLKLVKLIPATAAFPNINPVGDSTIHLNSTLYWDYLFLLKDSGTADFSFFSGDIPGIYTCIVQGWTEKGLMYKSVDFEVE